MLLILLAMRRAVWGAGARACGGWVCARRACACVLARASTRREVMMCARRDHDVMCAAGGGA